ncbi:protein smoothened-like [Liolophura sinensis]|uniref:protein smoothened-like n=1 Tax=Liolophura sinensis TaxID=3198878 RepID=UPI003159952D
MEFRLLIIDLKLMQHFTGYYLLLILTSIHQGTCAKPDSSCLTNVTKCDAFTSMNLTEVTCLGTKVKFNHTSLMFAKDSSSFAEVKEKLRLWSGLRNVPRCWDVVQSFLCSVYVPHCYADTNQVELPSKETCERAREPCKIVESYHGGWPDFLSCDQNYFKEACKNEDYDQSSFNKTSSCQWPLIVTENKASWYEEVQGCGLKCQNPLFTEAEHQQVHIFIAVLGTLCLICTLFTLLTFIIDWKTASRYPAMILFFVNACFFLGSIGWMAQFAGNARNDIVCKSDGTVRQGEPQLGSEESASCTIVFLVVYYFLLAGVTWFVMLSYAWHITFREMGTPRNSLSNKTSYFHIISWCFPLVLSIICLAISEIDGDSVSGICFVGYFTHSVRAIFVLAPITLVMIASLVFLVMGLITLVKLKKGTPGFISNKATAKIRETILRIGIFAFLAVAFMFITFAVHLYIFTNEQAWRDSLRDYIYCLGNTTTATSNKTVTSCEIENRPSLVAMEIHIFAFFSAGIIMSSWSWNKASFNAWERFLRKIFNKPSNKPVKLRKHKMIARAFERRKEMTNNGRLSISFQSTHDDPLGMKFELNSVSSREVSSSFAAAMPKLVRRRGGMVHPIAGTLRRYSDSDIGSVASNLGRRRSIESQLSQALQIVDQQKEELPKKKRKKKKKKFNRIRPLLEPISHAMAAARKAHGLPRRRGSDTSVISKASAHSIRFSIERNGAPQGSRPSSQSSSLENVSAIDLPCKPTATINIPKPHVTNFSMFTASSHRPNRLDHIELIDLSAEGPITGRATQVKVEMSEVEFHREAGEHNGGFTDDTLHLSDQDDLSSVEA